jgi:putative FmdB family regulatory protein
MPTYEYRCGACGHQVEVRHGIHEQGPAACEACGGTMRKALSSPAVLFKGSGWAKKDAQASSRSRSGGPAKDGGSSATETSPSAAGASRADSGTTTTGDKASSGAGKD